MIFDIKAFILWLNSSIWRCGYDPIHFLKVLIFIYITYNIIHYIVIEIIIGNYQVEQNKKAREKKRRNKKKYYNYR